MWKGLLFIILRCGWVLESPVEFLRPDLWEHFARLPMQVPWGLPVVTGRSFVPRHWRVFRGRERRSGRMSRWSALHQQARQLRLCARMWSGTSTLSKRWKMRRWGIRNNSRKANDLFYCFLLGGMCVIFIANIPRSYLLIFMVTHRPYSGPTLIYAKKKREWADREFSLPRKK